MYDLYAPIIPYVGMGGLQLGMSPKQVEAILERPLSNGKLIRNGTLREYIIDDAFALYFSTTEDKLKIMETRKDYKGLLLGKISTSTKEAELLKLDPTLIYNEFEEFYDSKAHGYQLITNLPDEKAEWILIYAHPTGMKADN